jgi:hypothetical protein
VTDGGPAAARGRKKVVGALVFAAGTVLVVAAPVARVVAEGRGEQRASDAALSAGDIARATVHARRAATAYVPFAPHVDRAYQRLREIALAAEARGDSEAALFAWRAVRSASIGSRFIASTATDQRRMADCAIARLSAATHAAGSPSQRALDRDIVRFQADLEAENVPSRARLSMLLGGLAALVGGAIWGVTRALSADGKFDLARAKGALILALIGGVGWICGLLIV